LIFDYSGSAKKIYILEPLIGKSGWMSINQLSVTAFDSEDHIILSGLLEDGRPIDEEQCKRIFSLEAQQIELVNIASDTLDKLASLSRSQETDILESISFRNGVFFEREMEKLDKWAEDVKTSLEIELKNLDKEIKFKKTESKKILNLEEKVSAQRNIKEMEKKRNTLRQDLFHAQDDVDKRKEDLIAKIETQLKQQLTKDNLFMIHWSIK
jgi:hypothetical protein